MSHSGGHCPLWGWGDILCSDRGQSRDAFQAILLEETGRMCNNVLYYKLLYVTIIDDNCVEYEFVLWWRAAVKADDVTKTLVTCAVVEEVGIYSAQVPTEIHRKWRVQHTDANQVCRLCWHVLSWIKIVLKSNTKIQIMTRYKCSAKSYNTYTFDMTFDLYWLWVCHLFVCLEHN